MSAFIGIAKVLELTMMSRVTLHRKIKNEEFPAPEKRGKKGSLLFAERAVYQWMENNSTFIDHREKKKNYNLVSLRFPDAQLKELKRASDLLQCNTDQFVLDAAMWKASKVIELAGAE